MLVTVCGIVVLVIAFLIVLGCILAAYITGLQKERLPEEVFRYGGLFPGVIGWFGYHMIRYGEVPDFRELSFLELFIMTISILLISEFCYWAFNLFGQKRSEKKQKT